MEGEEGEDRKAVSLCIHDDIAGQGREEGEGGLLMIKRPRWAG